MEHLKSIDGLKLSFWEDGQRMFFIADCELVCPSNFPVTVGPNVDLVVICCGFTCHKGSWHTRVY